MLSIGKLTSADSDRYYTRTVAAGREDYYAGRGEAPGYWAGSGVDLLMESDQEVSGEAFAAVLAGRAPDTGAALRGSTTGHAVSGFDLTFSAPKSVSILYAIGGHNVSRHVREAHDAALADALGYLEREACWTRRGAGGRQVVRGRGFVAAAFRHRTSRAGDPALHTHVVIGNMTEAEGRWSALDARHLYRHAKTAGYLYQAALRAGLTERLGVRWTTVERGAADVLGVPRELVEHFSRRRAEIVERMAERGEHSPRAAQIAALDTRRGKGPPVPVDRLRADWRARAEEHGFGLNELSGVLGQAERVPAERASFVQPPDHGPALDELTSENSVFDRRDVLRAWAARERQGAPVAAIERAADSWLGSGAATPVEPDSPGPWERRHSTPQMLRLERELIDTGIARQGEGAGSVTSAEIDEILVRRTDLNAEQAAVVRALTSSGDGVQLVRAAAGTGKTYALDAAREVWEAAGLRVVGCAVSARAALELRDQAGMETSTLARLQLDIRRGYNLSPDSVLIIDEAATVGTKDLAEVVRHADEMGAKVVLAGDDRQLPEIEAGGAFRGLSDRLGAAELHEVRRQREPWDREALSALRDGAVDDWLDAYTKHGRIRGGPNAESTRAQLVDDWWRAVRDTPEQDAVMIAHRRSDVAELNARARDRMRAVGALGEDELEVGERAFATGDRVIACHNDRTAGITNGSRGRVVELDHERQTITVDFGRAEPDQLDSAYLGDGKLDHGYAMTAHRAQGTTVDRSFVLGSDELYREWGYTALSRHRDGAYFYINDVEGQLGISGLDDHERDVTAGLAAGMDQTRAKELATDLLERWDGADPALHDVEALDAIEPGTSPDIELIELREDMSIAEASLADDLDAGM